MTELAVVTNSTELEAIKEGLEALKVRNESLTTLAETAKDTSISGVDDNEGTKESIPHILSKAPYMRNETKTGLH